MSIKLDTYYYQHADDFLTENDQCKKEFPFSIWKRVDKYISEELARCREEGDAIEIVRKLNGYNLISQ